jgi:hypothetical protein
MPGGYGLQPYGRAQLDRGFEYDLIGFFPLPESLDLDQMLPGFIVDFIAFLVAWFEIRRENSVDHIELVLQSAILFLQYPDSIE